VFGNCASGKNHEGSLCLAVSDTSLFIIIANSVLWQCAQSVKVRFTCGSAELHSSQDMATHQTCRSFLCAVFVCVICQMMCIVKMDMCFARFRAFDIKNNAKVHPAGGIVGSDVLFRQYFCRIRHPRSDTFLSDPTHLRNTDALIPCW
jgi:hypothetical protein